jgi:hypothetical protein
MSGCSDHLPGTPLIVSGGVKSNSSDMIGGVVSNYSKKMCGRVNVNSSEHIGEVSSNFSICSESY